jgi:predicted metalloendopeptidase
MITLFCGMLLTACIDENMDNPSVTPEEKPVVVNDMMDTSVKPGDDFFRYCNGRWIDGLTVNLETAEAQEQYYGFFPTEVQQMFDKNLSEVEYPSLKVISKHFDSVGADQAACDAIVAAAKKRLNDAADKGREQLWLTIGQMIKEGYPLPISIEMANKKDIMGVIFTAYRDVAYKDQEANPVVVPGSESAIGAEWPMLQKISEGLGFDAKYCYLPTEVTYFMDGETMDGSPDVRALSVIQACKPKTVAAVFGNELEKFLHTYYELAVDQTGYDNKKKSLMKELKDNLLQYEGHRAYVKKFVKPEAKSSLQALCDRFRKVFRKRLEANQWLSGETKTKAIEKLDNMTFCLGYPDTWYDNAMPDLSKTKNIVEDYLELRRANTTLMSDLFGKTVHEAEFNACFVDNSQTLDDYAYYKLSRNCILVCPILLCEPFVSSNGLTIEMFAYGMFFAHEMTHGFDSSGALYDKYGCEGSIIAEADKAEFDKRIQLLDDCYNSMETQPGSKVMCDGKATEVENIADLGGFLIAYDACKAWLEEEKGLKGEELKQQMRQFCIAYGNLWRSKYTLNYVKYAILVDTHSLNRERTNGVVRNSDAWYELFDIKPGDALYLAPEKRAYIW